MLNVAVSHICQSCIRIKSAGWALVCILDREQRRRVASSGAVAVAGDCCQHQPSLAAAALIYTRAVN